MSRKTVARIDLSALRHNLAVVRRLAPGSSVVSVIKADAYGHGIPAVTRALSGTDVFGVATAGEAGQVREAGWSGRLLLLEGAANPDDFELALELGLELVVHHAHQLEMLRRRGCSDGQVVWLKVDTGMHRLGFAADQAAVLLRELQSIPGVSEVIAMSHFACADERDHPLNRQQIEAFCAATDELGVARSMANSAALLNFPDAHWDYVRPGILLYGISPVGGQTGEALGLRPVMSLSCELIAINPCRRGDWVGYGATYECPEDMPVGVGAIGYGDGYPRHLRNGAPVLVNGRRASLAGRVSMDLITLDLRGHEHARAGDNVLLWGSGLPVEEVATWADAIPYELVCGVTGRVDRVLL